IADVRRLMNGLPPTAIGSERLAIRNIFATVLGRVMAGIGVPAPVAATRAFVNWTSSNAMSDTWYSEISRLLEILDSELATDLRLHHDRKDDKRVARVLRFIVAQCANPRLSLKDVAADATLSPWHLARILKQLTGR